MATITIMQKPAAKKIRVEVDLNQWEQLADALGFYHPSFVKNVKQSLKESRLGKVRIVNSLSELKQ